MEKEVKSLCEIENKVEELGIMIEKAYILNDGLYNAYFFDSEPSVNTLKEQYRNAVVCNMMIADYLDSMERQFKIIKKMIEEMSHVEKTGRKA